MLLGMSDNFQGPNRGGFRDRFQSETERGEQEIQDWLNANGGMVLAGVMIFVGIFFVLRLFS